VRSREDESCIDQARRASTHFHGLERSRVESVRMPGKEALSLDGSDRDDLFRPPLRTARWHTCGQGAGGG